MRIELTIDANYVTDWSTWEGCRELVQNGRDAEVDGAQMTVDHYDGNVLRIENEGAVLPHEALLLGRTTKAGRADQAGQWGEGLKLGVLALVRAGHAVKIRSGSEVWVPTIEKSDKFNAEVLVFNIQGGREDRKRVRVEISGIDAETWKSFRERFLFLNKRQLSTVETPSGTLMLGDRFAGRLYVKGIFVQSDPSLSYGYDLSDAQLDRDRKIIEHWDLKKRVMRIWTAAIGQRPDLLTDFYKMLENKKSDVDFVPYGADSISTDITKAVAARFTEQYGADAIPVDSLADSKDIEHLGKTGIVVSKPMGAILSQTLGDMKAVKARLQTEVIKTYSWGNLSAVERTNLESAIDLVTKAKGVLSLDDVDVVDFRSASLQGQFDNNRVVIAKKILADRDLTLTVCVHEAAHRHGGDGDKSHVMHIEETWSNIVGLLRGPKT